MGPWLLHRVDHERPELNGLGLMSAQAEEHGQKFLRGRFMRNNHSRCARSRWQCLCYVSISEFPLNVHKDRLFTGAYSLLEQPDKFHNRLKERLIDGDSHGMFYHQGVHDDLMEGVAGIGDEFRAECPLSYLSARETGMPTHECTGSARCVQIPGQAKRDAAGLEHLLC